MRLRYLASRSGPNDKADPLSARLSEKRDPYKYLSAHAVSLLFFFNQTCAQRSCHLTARQPKVCG